MKHTAISRSLLLALSLSMTVNTANCMEQSSSNKWITGITIIGGILLGKIALQALWQQTESFPFTDLPQDMQKEIIILLTQTTQAKTLEEAIQPIRALSMVNKQLYALFNDKNFINTLITYLSKKFDEGYMTVAKAIGTKTAKELYDEENIKISNAQDLVNSIYKHKIELFNTTIQKSNIDPSIRVLYPHYTALMLSVSLPQNNLFYNFSIPEESRSRHYQWCHENNITQRLLQHTTLKETINEKDLDGNTALLLALLACANQQNRELIKPSIKHLLDYGADPELANNNNLTPLKAAKNTGDDKLIQIIENAIRKNK